MFLYKAQAIINTGGHSKHSSYICKDVYKDGDKFVIHHATNNKWVEVTRLENGGWQIK